MSLALKQEVGHAYAPFSSTSDRDAGGAVRPPQFTTPGPGSYDVTGRRYQGGPRFLTAPSEVGFGSTQERASDSVKAQAWKPGPGAYEAPSDFARKRGPPTAPLAGSGTANGREDRHVVWFRAPSAPSIPRQDQAFGYEEGPLGQLIKQKAPVQTFKGERDDRVGPGNYDPSIAYTKAAARASDFSRSKAARTSISRLVPGGAAQELNPGPGTYELAAPKFEELPAHVRKPTSTFASRVLRPHQLPNRPDKHDHKSVPGPGAYVLPDSFTKVRASVPEALQCFGSTSKRSLEMQGAKRVPGPGAYDDLRSSFDADLGGVRMARRAAPFLSTGGRFDGSKARAGLPGPGAYDENNRNNFVAQLAKKRFSRGGNFGSTSKRFVPQKEEEVSTSARPAPGPGSYETQRRVKHQGQLKKGPMSVFISATGRFNANNRTEPKDLGPAPGQYYKSVEWGTGYKRPANGKTVFISTQDRFKDGMGPSNKSAVPGPGAYSQVSLYLLTPRTILPPSLPILSSLPPPRRLSLSVP
jgi:hypothetical protein